MSGVELNPLVLTEAGTAQRVVAEEIPGAERRRVKSLLLCGLAKGRTNPSNEHGGG